MGVGWSWGRCCGCGVVVGKMLRVWGGCGEDVAGVGWLWALVTEVHHIESQPSLLGQLEPAPLCSRPVNPLTTSRDTTAPNTW